MLRIVSNQNLLDCNLKTLKIPEVLFKRDLAIDPEIAYLLFQYSKIISNVSPRTLIVIQLNFENIR